MSDHIEKMRLLCKTNLKFLCKEVLKMGDWGGLHDEMARFLKVGGNRKLILVPRGSLKSSVITVGSNIQAMLVNPDIRILIGNAVWDNARKFMWKIQEYLTDKSLLPQLFGPFVSRRWNQDEMVISHRKMAHAEPTIATTGIEKTQTSQHYDRIVWDDPVVRENISTRDQMQKVLNAYRDSLDLLEPGGELIMVGTRWAMGDLYQYLMEEEMRSLNGHNFVEEGERKGWRDYVVA